MNNLSKILIAVAVIVLLFFVFNYFRGGEETGTESLVIQGNTKETTDAKYILGLLNKMTQVELRDSIFADQAFMRLQDNSVVLVPQSVSRENPFAPLNSLETNSAE